MKRKNSILVALILLAANPECAMSRCWGESLQRSNALEVVSTTPPVIPRLAVIVNVTTDVVVDLRVGESGAVESAEVAEGHPLLREATKSACLSWRFAPASTPARIVRLTFVYAELQRKDPPRVLILPYHIELPVAFAPFRDTVSYVPEDFARTGRRCEVHKISLRRDKVPIMYGLVGFKFGYLRARKALFPHSAEVAYGGCVIDDSSPKFAEVIYCSKCRAAEKRWSKVHRMDTRYSTTVQGCPLRDYC
jgi:hypothetical protein